MENDLYYGRGIMIGMTEEQQRFFAYFITGRSSSSKARKMDSHNGVVWTEPTDPEALEKGNVDLLIYNPIVTLDGRTFGISNGKQTESVLVSTIAHDGSMRMATEQWMYEPDEPNFTPRISANFSLDTNNYEMASILKEGDKARRPGFANDYEPGKIMILTTYKGPNVPKGTPLPSQDEPRILGTDGPIKSVDDLADMVEGHMGNPDYRVSLAVHLATGESSKDFLIRNYQE